MGENNILVQQPEQQANTGINPTSQQQAQPMQQPAIDVNAITSSLNSALEEKFNAFSQQMQQQQPVQQMTPEQREALNFKLREEFESDPMAFIDKIKSDAETSAIGKLQEQYNPMFEQTKALNERLQWQNRVRDFMARTPEAQAYMSQMTMVLQENPALLQTNDPLAVAYQMATAKDIVGQGGNVIDNLIGNEKYREKLMSNEQLRQAIIQDYQNKLNGQMTGGQTIPPIMGNNQSGSTIPASGGEQPRNLSEAKQAALRRMQLMQGNGFSR